MVAHPRSVSGGLCFILKFRLDRIYSFGDRAIFIFWHWLEIAYSRPLLRGFGGIVPQMTSSIVVTPKGTSLHGNMSLSHKAWKSVQRFDLGAGSRKKERTGQDSQKSHKGIIFHLLGEKPHWTDFYRNLYSTVAVPTQTHMQSFVLKFAGFTVFQGVEFSIFLFIDAWALQQCSANALPAILILM